MSPSTIEKKVKQAVAFLQKSGIPSADVGLVLGSGLGGFAEQFSEKIIIPYSEIPGFAPSTVTGHKGQLVFSSFQGVNLLMMQGRYHIYEGHEALQSALPILVMHALDVTILIATTASGGLNPLFSPGDLMIIRDHVNLLFQNPLRGFRWGDRPTKIDMSSPYSDRLIRIARDAAIKKGIPLKEGVYISAPGPNYETNAEIRMMRQIGDAVSMSTVPEILMARYLNMETLGISCITNSALPVRSKKTTHEEVIETGRAVEKKFFDLTTTILQDIAVYYNC
ncbi:MAG: purine-nucleoside phosphorylase [Candidatus Cloacimonetes bacterium 4572_55]|nr:MAG: purine-nucleoside phosphorylase [Candidatus Cloacimonetes bacterium 4572_55]